MFVGRIVVERQQPEELIFKVNELFLLEVIEFEELNTVSPKRTPLTIILCTSSTRKVRQLPIMIRSELG